MLSVSTERVSLKNIFVDIVDLAFIGEMAFSRNFENDWNKNVSFRKIFKIILINKKFAKFVKITKETAIHKNRFLQIFKENPVYGLLIEEVKLKVNLVMIC